MKLFVRILLIVIILVLVSVAALAVWQKDNIRSIINSFRYSDEELQKKIDENKKKVEELVESITRSKIRILHWKKRRELERRDYAQEALENRRGRVAKAGKPDDPRRIQLKTALPVIL